MTLGDRHLKPARSQLDGALDRGHSLVEKEGKKSRDSCEGEGRGSEEVCKDSSALSHHYNRLWLYRRLHRFSAPADKKPLGKVLRSGL